MRIVKQNRFKNLGELHKEWTEAGVKASRGTTDRRVEEFGYSCRQRRLTWAKEKKNWTVDQWPKVLFSDESKFCISFGNQGPRVWRKGGEAHSQVAWSPVLSFHSLWWFGCNVICWCWSIVFFENQRHCPRLPRNLEHFMLPSADQLFKDADFIFQQNTAPAHTAKSTKSWLNDQKTHQTWT